METDLSGEEGCRSQAEGVVEGDWKGGVDAEPLHARLRGLRRLEGNGKALNVRGRMCYDSARNLRDYLSTTCGTDHREDRMNKARNLKIFLIGYVRVNRTKFCFLYY